MYLVYVDAGASVPGMMLRKFVKLLCVEPHVVN